MDKVDRYILRCIREKKISVDVEQGTVYSHFAKRNFKIMKNWAGYCYLDFKFFNQRYSVLVHRIVYLAKYGKINKDMTIDHINRDTTDNRISNLRALTQSENNKNRRKSNGW